MFTVKAVIKVCTIAICILTLVTIGGCAKKPLTTIISRNSAPNINRILVIPFTNGSDTKRFETVATQICQSQCYRHGFEIVNEGDLRIFLQRKRLLLSQLVDEGAPQLFAELASELQIDALIKGKILTANHKQVQGESIPVISLQLDLLRANDGKLLANSFLTGSGEDYRTMMRFGVLRTSTQLLNQMIDNIINNWQNEGVFL